jgi:polyisoprenoid-binding protein YceI
MKDYFTDKRRFTMSWIIDSAHAQVRFAVRHMMITNVHGRFETFSGTVELDEKNPELSSVDVKIDASSINTNEPKRDAHLRSADFLNAEQYPYLTFSSTSVKQLDKNNAKVNGELAIRGVSRPVVLDVEYLGSAKSPWGTTSAGFNARTKINRKDWGLEWNVALETGGWLVGDEISIDIEMEVIKQEAAEAESVA